MLSDDQVKTLTEYMRTRSRVSYTEMGRVLGMSRQLFSYHLRTTAIEVKFTGKIERKDGSKCRKPSLASQ